MLGKVTYLKALCDIYMNPKLLVKGSKRYLGTLASGLYVRVHSILTKCCGDIIVIKVAFLVLEMYAKVIIIFFNFNTMYFDHNISPPSDLPRYSLPPSIF